MSNKSYRLGVGIMLLNSEKKVFVGKRIDSKKTAWQMPQGGINKGETEEKAALRELYEETWIKKIKIISKSKKIFKYEIPSFIKKNLWNNQYVGQKQKWFLMQFKGIENKDINLNVSKSEFSDWKWIHIKDLEKSIVAFKKKMYKKIIKEFLPIIKKI